MSASSASSAPKPRRRAPAQVFDLDTWQFVRLMVALEGAKQRGIRSAAALYQIWAEPWEEVDQRLTDLGRSDFAAFSALMMETRVTLSLPSGHRGTLAHTMHHLIERMERDAQHMRDKTKKQDLRFEVAALRETQSQLGLVEGKT